MQVALCAPSPKSLGSVALKMGSRLGLHPRGTRDFLDALVVLGFWQRRNGQYANSLEIDLLLDKKKPSYVGGILEMANHRLFGLCPDWWSHQCPIGRT